MRYTLGVLLALALLGPAGCAARGETVTLSGHVVDPAGQPLQGIEVGFYKKGVFASDRAGVSESDGSWEVEVPRAFMDPPAGRLFFQDVARQGLTLHRASELPEPVVLELRPPRAPEEEPPGAPAGGGD